MANTANSLGNKLRVARDGAGLTLRDVARKVGKTPSYLSDIENDRRVPAEALIYELADLFDLDARELMALGGRMAAGTEEYMKRHPTLSTLLQEIIENDLTDDELARLLGSLHRMVKARTAARDA